MTWRHIGWPLRRDASQGASQKGCTNVKLRNASITNVSEAHWESGLSRLFMAG
jgi:hypothetical protein